MRTSSKIALGSLAVITGILFVDIFTSRTGEQIYVEHSSEQGGLEHIKFIGWSEEKTSGSLGELVNQGRIQEGDAVYFNENEYALFSGGKYVAEVYDKKTRKVTQIAVPYETIEGFNVEMIKRPIRNKDFRGD
ncbi:hypothetical protein FJZ19_04910 [Candidatus Pacearchaeota archaeon]|nr:hypothetical protein [Candidatus Pacearchaeota archaeon]